MAKVPQFDMLSLAQSYTKARMERAMEEVNNDLESFKQNHAVICKLIAGGILPAKDVTDTMLKWGHIICVRKCQLKRIRGIIGDFDEYSKDLHDAKNRILKIQLSMKEFQKSSIRFQYLRPYPKSEEATKPCKIVMVQVSDAQEATPAKFAPMLMCENT